MLYRSMRPALFALDPEKAHRLALELLGAGRRLPVKAVPGDPLTLMGLRFPNRVGLAAGFDKNAEAVDGLGRLGFGFLEIGTVTPRPQRGQPLPRLFRLPAEGALINRLGFPNDGAGVIAARLRRRRYGGVLGVNIGKNADTPIDRAVKDYLICLRTLHRVCDYVAINISSPNTAALRELHAPERLEPLLGALLAERASLLRGTPRSLPLLLKVSPDLEDEGIKQIADVVRKLSLDGIIATNTTLARNSAQSAARKQQGGLSGSPLHPLAIRVVADLRARLGPSFPIIGVGGVDSAASALALCSAGADLVQIYTGLIYRGPKLVKDCVRALASVGPKMVERR